MRRDVTDYIWQHSRCKGAELLLLLAIAWNANKDGVAWPSVSTLARRMRMSVRQVARLISKVARRRPVELTVRRNSSKAGTHLYQINMNLSLPLFGEDDILSTDKLTGGDKKTPTNRAKTTVKLSPESRKNLRHRPAKRGNGSTVDSSQPPAADDFEFPHGTTERQRARLLDIGKKYGFDRGQLQLTFDEVRGRQERREPVLSIVGLTDDIAQQIRTGTFRGDRAAEQERARGGGRPLSGEELAVVRKLKRVA